jgi:hypothetical protein
VNLGGKILTKAVADGDDAEDVDLSREGLLQSGEEKIERRAMRGETYRFEIVGSEPMEGSGWGAQTKGIGDDDAVGVERLNGAKIIFRSGGGIDDVNNGIILELLCETGTETIVTLKGIADANQNCLGGKVFFELGGDHPQTSRNSTFRRQ